MEGDGGSWRGGREKEGGRGRERQRGRGRGRGRGRERERERAGKQVALQTAPPALCRYMASADEREGEGAG
eukprot:3839994-Rhodomonas_salina.1